MFIFDASTLILAAKMETLESFLDSVEFDDAIPLEVEKECAAKRSLDALMIQKALNESRIRVAAVKNKKLVTKLEGDFGLGRGEAEAIAIDARVPVLSFIYGFPPSEVLEECRKQAIRTIGTATTPEEAMALEDAGLDSIVASGFEGGGHRGSFLRSAADSLIGSFSLFLR